MSSGARYVFRGLRQGRMWLVVVGMFMILRRVLAWRRRRDGVVHVNLKRGSSVALRVSGPTDDPVTFSSEPLR